MGAAPDRLHSDETKEMLRQMWASGMSATQIGIALGMGKNAVIGLVNRCRAVHGEAKWPMRLSKRTPRSLPYKRHTAPKPKPKSVAPPKPKRSPTPVPSPIKPQTLSWEDWTDRQGYGDRLLCAYLEGDPRDLDSLRCCSGRVDYESVWCSYHKGVCTVPRTPAKGEGLFRLPKTGVVA